MRAFVLICLGLATAALGACTNPDAQSTTSVASTSATQNSGEPPAPPPPRAASEAPAAVAATPASALIAFALRYVNWTYRTLGTEQRALAAMSVGAARRAELQAAAASTGDSTLRRGHLHNSGKLVSVAPDLSSSGNWVVVTREQTGGDGEYEGLKPAYHVTLARVARVGRGYAVSDWEPQS